MLVILHTKAEIPEPPKHKWYTDPGMPGDLMIAPVTAGVRHAKLNYMMNTLKMPKPNPTPNARMQRLLCVLPKFLSICKTIPFRSPHSAKEANWPIQARRIMASRCHRRDTPPSIGELAKRPGVSLKDPGKLVRIQYSWGVAASPR